MMDAARVMEYLKFEFGIKSREEFDEAVSESKGIDLGLFTMPFKGGAKGDQKATWEGD